MIEDRKTIPIAEDVEEFIKSGNESERIALENLKNISPAIKNLTSSESQLRYPYPSPQMMAEGSCEGKCKTCEGKEICWKTHFSMGQENREKEGRKIWEIIKQHYNPVCTTCFEEKNECLVCAADAVYDYMINKLEEVQKKTAGNILTEFYFTIFHMYDEDDAEMIERLVKNLSEQYCARYRND